MIASQQFILNSVCNAYHYAICMHRNIKYHKSCLSFYFRYVFNVAPKKVKSKSKKQAYFLREWMQMHFKWEIQRIKINIYLHNHRVVLRATQEHEIENIEQRFIHSHSSNSKNTCIQVIFKLKEQNLKKNIFQVSLKSYV